MNWGRAIVYLLGAAFTLAGLTSLTEGIAGLVGGILLIVGGVFCFPGPRRRLLARLDTRTEINLSGISTAVVLVLAVLTAGAGTMVVPTEDVDTDTDRAASAPETTAPTESPTPTVTPTATATPTPTATATPSPTPSPPQTAWTVTVVEVVDGDTMNVRLPNGSVETVRLLGVDTPETSVTETSPDEWEGIPDTTDGWDWLANWGSDATRYAEDRLAGQEVYIEVDPEADRRGYYGRLLVYIYQSEDAEKSFNERLLTNGYARYYDSTFSQQDSFQAAETTARGGDVGVWAYTGPTDTPADTGDGSGGGVIVASIHENAEGNDNENLNDEYVTFENTGDEVVDLSGWTVSDEADHVYTFSSGFTLEAGDSVTLYTGDGVDSDDELYWGENGAVWNNGGDTVYLEDDSGETVDTYAY